MTETTYYPLGGGLDVVTPALSVPPGRLLTSVNFEPAFGDGYRRVAGFERFDGRPRPHLQTFVGFDLVDSTGLTEGTIVTGDTSGATGTVIGISGNSIGVTKDTGDFLSGEFLNTGAYQIDPSSTPVRNQAPDQDAEDEFNRNTWTEYRDDILVVPGEGQVRGIVRLKDKTYAWRNNAGETACIMHEASAAGWVPVAASKFGHTLKFDNGTDTPGPIWQVGDTVTGATSSATGVIHRLTDWGGSYGGNDATGYLVLTAVTGTFTDGENLQVGGNTIATANGASAQFGWSPTGEYRFHLHNFFGGAASFRAYGVNAIDNAFEIDEGGVVSEILIPTTADLLGQADNNEPPDGTPFLVEEHRNHLFLAFPGGRVVHSSVGRPLNFSGLLSAAEFGLGDEVTGLDSVVGGALVMTTARDTQALFGDNITNWEKRLIGERTGGRIYSTQKLDVVYGLDDLGITSVARTETFGDFVGATVSQLVQPIVTFLRDRLTDSSIVRATNQVRWYFDDNTAIIMYVPQPGAVNESRGTTTALKVQFGAATLPFPVRRVYDGEDETNNERIFFASDDGYVYEDQVGTNYDGRNIQAYLRTAFTYLGTPAYRKRFRRLDIELSSQKPLKLLVASDLTYGAPEISSSITEVTVNDVPEVNIFSGGGFWDTDNWDEFFWDGQNISNGRAQLRGTGENISFLIFNDSDVTRPFTIQGLTVHYDRRRLQR